MARERINVVPDGYKIRCAECNKSVADTEKPPFGTLTSGYGRDEVSILMVVFYCDEHKHIAPLDTIRKWMG